MYVSATVGATRGWRGLLAPSAFGFLEDAVATSSSPAGTGVIATPAVLDDEFIDLDTLAARLLGRLAMVDVSGEVIRDDGTIGTSSSSAPTEGGVGRSLFFFLGIVYVAKCLGCYM